MWLRAGEIARLSGKQKWVCVLGTFDYNDRLWRVAFGFRALIFLPPPFSVCLNARWSVPSGHRELADAWKGATSTG